MLNLRLSMSPGVITATSSKLSHISSPSKLPQVNTNSVFPSTRTPLSVACRPLELSLPRSGFPLALRFSHTPKYSSVANEQLTASSREGTTPTGEDQWRIEEGTPTVPSLIVPPAKLSLTDQAFFLLAFIVCTTSVAFTSLVIAAVPALHAMGRAAISLSKFADTAREELPSTMAAIRLSGMEISDLTLELSDLSQEIADGVSKSAQAVHAAEAGIRQIGSRARQQTMSMIEERANLPPISLQPVVIGAAKKTSQAVGQATKTFMNIFSRGECSSDNESANAIERLEI